MKTSLFLIVWLCPILLMAEDETNAPPNYAVQFYGVNSANLPFYWPKVISNIGTNTVAPDGWAFFTEEQLAELKATNAAAFKVAQDAKHAALQASINAKIAALVAAYSNLQWCADNWASVTNLATLRIAVKAEGDVLLKLKPVLSDIYRPETDTTP